MKFLQRFAHVWNTTRLNGWLTIAQTPKIWPWTLHKTSVDNCSKTFRLYKLSRRCLSDVYDFVESKCVEQSSCVLSNSHFPGWITHIRKYELRYWINLFVLILIWHYALQCETWYYTLGSTTMLGWSTKYWFTSQSPDHAFIARTCIS